MSVEIVNTEEAVLEYVKSLSNRDLIDLWNQGDPGDDYIYWNEDEFFDMCFSNTIDAVRAVCYGEYQYQDEYVQFDGYANLVSFNACDAESFIDFGTIVDKIMESPSDFDIDLIDEEDEDEDDAD